MSSLEELVTGALPEIPEEEFSPLPPLSIEKEVSGVTEDEIIQLCQDFREDLPGSPGQAPYRLVQILMYIERCWNVRSILRPNNLFALAATYALSGEEQLLRELQSWALGVEEEIVLQRERRAEEALIGTVASQVDFLREILGDDLASELVHITGVRPPTAKRWIAGSSRPSWEHRQKISLLARAIYSCRYRADMDSKEILSWYNNPFSGGDSPREMIGRFRVVMEDNLADALASVGCSAK